MHDYPTAYDDEHLHELLSANDSCPDPAMDEVSRLTDLAAQRASRRGETTALDADDPECVIATDWTGYASDEFGYDNGDVNAFAMGQLDERASGGKDATLFTDTAVIQNGWLRTGDGRRASVVEYEDDEFEKASPGELWIPNSAQQYMAIIAIAPECIHGDADAADAM